MILKNIEKNGIYQKEIPQYTLLINFLSFLPLILNHAFFTNTLFPNLLRITDKKLIAYSIPQKKIAKKMTTRRRKHLLKKFRSNLTKVLSMKKRIGEIHCY